MIILELLFMLVWDETGNFCGKKLSHCHLRKENPIISMSRFSFVQNEVAFN